MLTTKVTTAGELGVWIRRELARPDTDTVHITRVVTQEIGRWFTDGLTDQDILAAAADSADTGSRKWDAFVEGVAAHLLHRHGLTAPPWTGRTELSEGWAPNDLHSIDWHLINVLMTPVELLHKGVVFSRANLERL